VAILEYVAIESIIYIVEYFVFTNMAPIQNTKKIKDTNSHCGYNESYYSKNKEKVKEKARERYRNTTPENKAARALKRREYRKNNSTDISNNKKKYYLDPQNKLAKKMSDRSTYLNRKYKITIEAFNAMVLAQNNKCKICNKHGSHTTNKILYIDHDHNSGKIRGLLCNMCNLALGYAMDSVNTLQKCVEYLTTGIKPTPKKCLSCDLNKDLDFYKINTKNNTISHICISCKKDKTVYTNIKQRTKTLSKFELNIRSKYGITLDDYHMLLTEQKEKCAICIIDLSNIPNSNKHIDHNHSNYKVRGILCKKCNSLLGNLKEDIAIILKMIQYLEQNIGDKNE